MFTEFEGGIEELMEFMEAIGAFDDDVEVEIIGGHKGIEEALEKKKASMKEAKEAEREKYLKEIAELEKAVEERKDEETERLRKEAKGAKDELLKEFGEEKTNNVIKMASVSAMLICLLNDSIPLDQTMVDEYNDLCVKVHPERASGFMCKLAYSALREMAKEGIDSLE